MMSMTKVTAKPCKGISKNLKMMKIINDNPNDTVTKNKLKKTYN